MVNYTYAANDKSPELDERVWQAWIKKNAAQDRARFVRCVRVLGIVTAFSGVDCVVVETCHVIVTARPLKPEISFMSDQMQRQIRLRGVRSGKISTDEEAANAITKFNGMDFNGRSLTINEARPIVRRDRGVGRSGDSGGGRDHGKYGGGRNRW